MQRPLSRLRRQLPLRRGANERTPKIYFVHVHIAKSQLHIAMHHCVLKGRIVMIPNNKIFYNKNEIIYDGKLYSRLYRMIDSPGRYILHFEFISTNSDYEQCIGLSLFKFKGAVYINGERVKLGRGEFTGMQFSERTAPQKFNVEIDMKSGVISIYNSARGWREDIINHTPSAVPAMIVDKTGDNSYIFHCNDYVYDDDFDDLVFSLEIIKL